MVRKGGADEISDGQCSIRCGEQGSLRRAGGQVRRRLQLFLGGCAIPHLRFKDCPSFWLATEHTCLQAAGGTLPLWHVLVVARLPHHKW